MKAYDIKKIYATKEGSAIIACKGYTEVDSPWSEGWRTTSFDITFDAKGNISWSPFKRSRTPYWWDTFDAIAEILERVNPVSGDVFFEENIMKVRYACIMHNGAKHSLGVDPNGKLSIRGKQSIPAEVLKRLMEEDIRPWWEHEEEPEA